MANSPCVICKKVHDYGREQSFMKCLKDPRYFARTPDGQHGDDLVKNGTRVVSREVSVHLIDTELVMIPFSIHHG